MIASIILHAVALVLHFAALAMAIGIGLRSDEDDDKGVMMASLIGGAAFLMAFILQVIA